MLRFRIREEAQQQGVSLAALSRLAEIDPKTVRALMSGSYYDVKVSTLHRCARALGVPLERLVEEQEDQPEQQKSQIRVQVAEKVLDENPEPLRSIFIQGACLIEEEARALLSKHGVQIEQQARACIIEFPAGSTRQAVTTGADYLRYRIVLPDGYVMLQLFYPAANANGRSEVLCWQEQ